MKIKRQHNEQKQLISTVMLGDNIYNKFILKK